VKVAFAGTFAARLADPVRDRLRAPFEIVLADESTIAAVLPDVDVLVTMAFTHEMTAVTKRLRLVQVPGAGLDRIDRSALPTGTALANAYGHEVGIAEWVFGAMLMLSRELGRLDAALRRGVWESQWAIGGPPPAPWPELAGRTLAILGYGRIGQCLARRARAFLSRADAVAITMPLTAATCGLLGARELALMKPSAWLLNPARAEIVDEDALYEALRARRIGGAALDVWYRYPSGAGPTFPAHRPFHELSNVVMTPHVSGWTEGMLSARATLIADNVERVRRGERPLNLIT
jgi:phosphoglycerate dehydrogenase-like enzyme